VQAQIVELPRRAGYDDRHDEADRDRVERSELRVPDFIEAVPQRNTEGAEHEACREREEDGVQRL
jgi:hypothetical protein